MEIAFGIGVLGHLIFVAAEVHSLSQRATSDLLPLGAIVSAVGLLLTGVAVLRAKQWQGWTRWVPFPSVAPPGSPLLRLPLRYQQQAVGLLLVASRTGEVRFTDADHWLLTDLARQTGIAVYATQLTVDVQ